MLQKRDKFSNHRKLLIIKMNQKERKYFYSFKNCINVQRGHAYILLKHIKHISCKN